MKITAITAREILDSRGIPTVEACVTLSSGIKASAAVPSGTSTGVHEAHELRDGGKRFGGLGVLKACANVNKKISYALRGKDPCHQEEIDAEMIALDGTKEKKKLGANAILSVSLACARAASLQKKKPLYVHLRSLFFHEEKKYRMPVPLVNVFNGGRHAGQGLDVQEVLIIPHGKKLFRERVRLAAEFFYALQKELEQRHASILVGTEDGYTSPIPNLDEMFLFLNRVARKAGYTPGQDFSYGMDIAASELYDEQKKQYILSRQKQIFSAHELAQYYERLSASFPLTVLEDPFYEDAWDDFSALTHRVGHRTLVVGDDLYATNLERIRNGAEHSATNAVLIKPNQIGTLTETALAILFAKKTKQSVVVSHRSGETLDDFIADLSVAANAEYAKLGACRGERIAKYNRLLAIADELGY